MRFSKINILSSNGLFIIVLLGFISAVNIGCYSKADQIPVLFFVFVIIVDLFIVGLIIWGLTSKITISNSGIRYKSMFKDLTIDWNQIKTFGVYITGSNVKTVIEKTDYDKFVLAGQKNIFITDKEDFSPSMFKIRPNSEFKYIDFHYRPKAIDMIEQKMINK